MRPQWSDPHLGLARVHIWGLGDLGSGRRALDEARQYDHQPGKRDLWILGWGYCQRAQRLWDESLRARNSDVEVERDLLQRSKQDFEQGIEIYQSILPFGNTINDLNNARRRLQAVEDRLSLIDEEAEGT